MYQFLDGDTVRKDKRLIWAVNRSVMENMGLALKKNGRKSKSHWNLFLFLLRIFAFLLKITGYFKKGYGNAKTIRVNELTLNFPSLPDAFSGFRILHLSDLHIDSIPGFAALLIQKIDSLPFDCCLLTVSIR